LGSAVAGTTCNLALSSGSSPTTCSVTAPFQLSAGTVITLVSPGQTTTGVQAVAYVSFSCF